MAAFRRLALVKRHAVAKPRVDHLPQTYFDTPGLHLRERGVDLHLRDTCSGWIETLHADRDALAGLHYRRNWEVPIERPQPDLRTLAALIDEDSVWAEALTAP